MVEVQKSPGAQPPASQQFLGLGVKLLLLLFLPELVFKLQRRGSQAPTKTRIQLSRKRPQFERLRIPLPRLK